MVPTLLVLPTPEPSASEEPTTVPTLLVLPTPEPSVSEEPTTVPSLLVLPTSLPSASEEPTTVPSLLVLPTSEPSASFGPTPLALPTPGPTTRPTIGPTEEPTTPDPTVVPTEPVTPKPTPRSPPKPTRKPTPKRPPKAMHKPTPMRPVKPTRKPAHKPVPGRRPGQSDFCPPTRRKSRRRMRKRARMSDRQRMSVSKKESTSGRSRYLEIYKSKKYGKGYRKLHKDGTYIIQEVNFLSFFFKTIYRTVSLQIWNLIARICKITTSNTSGDRIQGALNTSIPKHGLVQTHQGTYNEGTLGSAQRRKQQVPPLLSQYSAPARREGDIR